MALYNYECPKCEKVFEISHGMMENPEIKCETCETVMKRLITGGSGYIMKSGSTRGRTDRARYGNKKKFSQSTPTESAYAKAEQKREEKNSQYNPADPYGQFRD